MPPLRPHTVLECEAPPQTLLFPFPHVKGSRRAPGSAETRFRQELEAWTTDFALPTTVWLAGFFNPQSFLTAIMQSMARKNEWPLDKMCLSVEVTKKNREDMTAPPREGSYVYGLFMEGNESAGLRKLPEPVPLGWRTETSREGQVAGAGKRGASARGMTPSMLRQHRGTKSAAEGSRPGSVGPETAGASSGASTCFRVVRSAALQGGPRGREPGADGLLGVPVFSPQSQLRGARPSSSTEGTSRPHQPVLSWQRPQGCQAAWSLRPVGLGASFSTTNCPTQRLMPPPYLWGVRA